MRIAIYTRISTDEDNQPFSLGAQQDRLDAYCKSQDDWRIVARYSDQASGATLERPGLQRALAEAGKGVYELLLVHRVDRLSRNVPSIMDMPAACKFCTRCPEVFDRCHVEEPPLHHIGDGQLGRCHLLEDVAVRETTKAGRHEDGK